MRREKRRQYCLFPCPDYDVAGMEGWLEEMAQRGWFLEKDGIFAFVGMAAFERGEPRPVRYRLAGILKGGGPDTEEIVLSEKYGWRYVSKRGDFTIYRTDDPDTRELNTDPEVQAEAVKAVKKRRRRAVIDSILWLLLSPILSFLRYGYFLEAVVVHSWFLLLFEGFILLQIAMHLREVVCLGKLQKQLRQGEVVTPYSPAKRQVRRYWGPRVVLALYPVVLVAVGLCLGAAQDASEMPLSQYDQTPPFATIAGLAGGGASGYRETLPDNTVLEWTDCLAPRNIRWTEFAQITRADGTVLHGLLSVDYHVTAARWFAAGLARDYVRYDRRLNFMFFKSLDLPPLDGVEYVRAYEAAFPTVVFQKGNIVVHASFSQDRERPEMPLEEWVAALVESIG